MRCYRRVRSPPGGPPPVCPRPAPRHPAPSRRGEATRAAPPPPSPHLRRGVRAAGQRGTLCVGRTHGVHAEPPTFGLRLAGLAFEADRNLARLTDAFGQLRFGKLSGAVGTYASVPPAVEARVMERLGLGREDVATQVIPRDRHAVLTSRVAIAGAGLERFATEGRNLQRTAGRQ